MIAAYPLEEYMLLTVDSISPGRPFAPRRTSSCADLEVAYFICDCIKIAAGYGAGASSSPMSFTSSIMTYLVDFIFGVMLPPT